MIETKGLVEFLNLILLASKIKNQLNLRKKVYGLNKLKKDQDLIQIDLTNKQKGEYKAWDFCFFKSGNFLKR